jgi:hypothetical protein
MADHKGDFAGLNIHNSTVHGLYIGVMSGGVLALGRSKFNLKGHLEVHKEKKLQKEAWSKSKSSTSARSKHYTGTYAMLVVPSD